MRDAFDLNRLWADELEVGLRTQNALHALGCKTFRDITKLTEAEFMRAPNCGRKSLNEMKEVLSARGLKFAGLPIHQHNERSRIVSWLREGTRREIYSDLGKHMMDELARAIERGDHLTDGV